MKATTKTAPCGPFSCFSLSSDQLIRAVTLQGLVGSDHARELQVILGRVCVQDLTYRYHPSARCDLIFSENGVIDVAIPQAIRAYADTWRFTQQFQDCQSHRNDENPSAEASEEQPFSETTRQPATIQARSQ